METLHLPQHLGAGGLFHKLFAKFKTGHWPIFLLSSFSSLTNLFLPIILVRMLTPEDMGVYKIFFLHLSAIPYYFMTGGPVNSIYFWVGKPLDVRMKYIQSTWVLSLILSAMILVVGIPLANYFSNYLSFPLTFIFLLIISGTLSLPATHYTEANVALGKTFKGSIFDTVYEIIKTAGFLFIAWKFKSLNYLFIFYALVLFVKFVTTTVLSEKEKLISYSFDFPKIKEIFKYCLPISIASCLGFFADKVDLLILSGQLSSADFAFYSMGCLVIPPLYLIEMSVQKILIPNLSEKYITQRYQEAAHDYRKAISDIAFLMIPAVFGLYFFAEPITTLLYTNAYKNSVPFLQIYAFSYLLFLIPHDSVPRASGHTKWILKIYVLVTPVSLVAVYYAAKNYGAMAALSTSIVVKFLPKIVGIIYSKKIMQWSWADMFPVKKISILVGVSVFLTALSLIVKPYFEQSLNWFLICAPLFAVSYFAIFNLLLGKYHDEYR